MNRTIAVVFGLWATCVGVALLVTWTLVGLDAGSWTLAGMIASLLGVLLSGVATIVPSPNAIDAELEQPPRRSRLTTKAMLSLPAYGLIPMFWLVPVSSAAIGATERSHQSLAFAIVGGTVLAAIACGMTSRLRRQRQLVEFGDCSSGTIDTLDGRMLRYSFDAAGVRHTGSCRSDGRLQPNASIIVLYDPTNPNRNLIAGNALFEPAGLAVPVARDVSRR